MDWQSITDLSERDLAYANPELGPLQGVWGEQRDSLREAGLLDPFITSLVREWSVETGILERLYTIERGVTQVLIERGFDAALIPHGATNRPADEVIEVLRDHESSAELVFDVVKDERPLSVGLIKELHSLITRHQETVEGRDEFGRRTLTQLDRGEYKKLPNNPTRPDGTVHTYCPPVHVASEMERLVALHGQHLASGVPVDVSAAWLHHRFTQIHPFADGNGRVARAIANIVFIQAGWFPLVVRSESRPEYIDALEAADRGDLAPLVRLFGAIEKGAFVNALQLAESVRRTETSFDEMLEVIGAELRASEPERIERYQAVELLGDSLLDAAIEQVNFLAERLEPLLVSQKNHNVYEDHRRNGEAGSDWTRYTVVAAARALGYYANVDSFSSWTRMRIRTDAGQWEIVVSLHGLGQKWRGVIAGTVLIDRMVKEEDRPIRNVDILPSVDDVFQLNYRDDPEQSRDRFRSWLDRGLLTALQQWREASKLAR